MQKFQPAFIKLQPESIEPYSTYNSRVQNAQMRSHLYETKNSEDFIANTRNFVDSVVLENEYFSRQIRQKNSTIKLEPKNMSKAKKEDIIKRNIYMVSRLEKTQKALDEKSKQNKAKKIANRPKPDSFTPMLNKKSLVIASKKRDKSVLSQSRMSAKYDRGTKLRRSEPSHEDFEDTSNKSFFYYDKSKKTVSHMSISKPKKLVPIKKADRSSSASRKSEPGFRPAINKKSKMLAERMGYDKEERSKELLDLHKQRMQFRRELGNVLQEQKEEDELRECSFKPKINRSNSITFDCKVEKRLQHWDSVRKQKLESMNVELLEKEARATSRPKKRAVRDDLSFVSRESVQKSISKFLYWKDYSKKKQKDKETLKAKFCLLRSNI